jgi:hypothetical protein
LAVIFQQPETRWESAKRRRRIFTSPLKDFLVGVLVVLVTFVLMFLQVAEITTESILVAGGAALAAALLGPFAEAAVNWFRVPRLEAQEEVDRLNLSSLAAKPGTATPPIAVLPHINTNRVVSALPISVVERVPSDPAPVADKLLATDIDLAWQPEAEGLHFRVRNLMPNRVDELEVSVMDLRKWSPEHGAFLEAKDSGCVNGKFIRFRLNPPTFPIFYGEDGTVRFLNLTPEGYLFYGGERMRRPSPQRTHGYITEPGIWQVKISVATQGRSRSETLCVQWDKRYEIARPVACPA